MITLKPLAMIIPTEIDILLDLAFGADRRSRTAYKIRAGTSWLPALSFAATSNGDLVGIIQCWPVALMIDGGDMAPLIMIGPVAVRPDCQRDGVGRALMGHVLGVAEEKAANRALMLIGDPEYYGRFFGFSAENTALWRAPGPIEQHRLLARGPDVPAAPGLLGPRIGAVA